MKMMNTPRSVDISITNRCNLRCKYCSHFSGAGDVGQDLSAEEWLRFFEELNQCAVLNVTLQGGEPFYREDLRQIIAGIVSNRMRFDIHRKNVRELDRIARLLLEDIGLDDFSTNSASYMGLCRRNAEQVQLTVEERSIAMEELLNLSEKYNGRISATAGPLAEASSWNMMEEARQAGKKDDFEGGFLSACGGPMNTIAVRADGVLVPCIQMSHIELGRINRDDLKTVWQKHPELKRLRGRYNIPLSDFEFCKGCEYIDYCTGNCPALAYLILGDENHPSPDACLKRFLKAGGRLPG